MTKDEFTKQGTLCLYDVNVDEFRAATQDDLDRAMKFISTFARSIQLSEDPVILEAREVWKEFMAAERTGEDSNGN
jgi:hypothetical protein